VAAAAKATTSPERSMAIFVQLNGFALRATADDAEAFLIEEVIQARAPVARITTWIEEHLEPVAVG